MLVSQQGMDVTLVTPLGSDALILDSLSGYEQSCAPFCFTLDMHSLQTSINFTSMVGQQASVCLDIGGGIQRYFSGVIGEIEQLTTVPDEKDRQTLYRANIYPTFWMLKFTKDYHIFQFKSAMDIIMEVLGANGVTMVSDRTTSCGKSPREYCVQYGESHFNFVCRLMEEEGIFYYFEHTAGGDILVLQDDPGSLSSCAGTPFKVSNSQSSNSLLNEIQLMAVQQQVVSKGYATADYNFKTASVHLYNTVSGDGAAGQVYSYPGVYLTSGEGDGIANLRIQELEWFKNTVKGESTAPGLCPMFKMGVTDHLRADANQTYVVYRVEHEIQKHFPKKEGVVDFDYTHIPVLYRNKFVSFPDSIPFRAPIVTPKPIIPSTQTARVTGKPGEEIWTDEYGRIKVKFHWDQYGSDDDKSSCWIRVAQLWAGSNWGGVWIPRVGMEVVVTFLEGNPDRPLITGCVYNSDNMPPYLPSEPTKSTIKSNSTKGGGGYNEFRFEDKKGSEEIYTQAEKDKNSLVKDSRYLEIRTGNDTTDIMQGDRTVTLLAIKGKRPQRGDDTLTLLKGSRLVELKAQGEKTANHTKKLHRGDDTTYIMKGNQFVTIDKGDQHFHLKLGSRTVLLNKGDEDTTLNLGNQSTTLNKGDQSHTLNLGDQTTRLDKGNQTITLKQGNQKITLFEGNQTITIIRGNRSLTLFSGSEKIMILGRRTIKVAGMESHLNLGSYSHKVVGSYSLKVLGSLSVEVLGSTSFKSIGDFSINCLGNITMRAAACFTVQAMVVNIQGLIETSVVAGACLNLNSGALANYTAGAINTISGALVEIN